MSVYVTDAELNSRFGTTNIAMWADLDGTWVKGTSESAAMTARRLAARTYASNRVDDRLRRSDLNFNLPLTGTIPTTLVDICVKLAGYWLSTARGTTSFDQKGNPISRLWGDRNEALAELELIATGEIRLDI